MNKQLGTTTKRLIGFNGYQIDWIHINAFVWDQHIFVSPIFSIFSIIKEYLLRLMPRKHHKTHKKQKPSDLAPSKQLPSTKKNNLKNIVELTQQNDTYRFNEDINDEVLLNNSNLHRKSLFGRSCQCFKSLLDRFKPSNQISMVVREEQVMKTIEKLKSQNVVEKSSLPPLDPQESNKKTLVIDLDGTLLHSTFTQPEHYDHCTSIPFKNSTIKVYTQLRFGVESFLFQMSKIYEIVLYTVRKQLYANKMKQLIDKKKWISHVLYKDKCITLNKVHRLKTIKVLGRNPRNVIFLDHDPVAGILQPDNFCQIKCFSGEKNDRELIKIMPFLKELCQKKTVTPVYSHFEEFYNRQIRLQFLNLDSESKREDPKKMPFNSRDLNTEQSHIEEKKKKYGHKKTNSEVESLAKNMQENQTEDNTTAHDHEDSACQFRAKKFSQM